jgi:hypothetical protein
VILWHVEYPLIMHFRIQETIRTQLYVIQTLFGNTLKLTVPEPGREHIYIYIFNLVLTSFDTHLNNFDTS